MSDTTDDIKVIKLKQVDSTSTYARNQLSKEEKPQAFVVIADEQSEGRGRIGRQWLSPKGNIYFTMAIPANKVSPNLLPKAPLYVAQAIAYSLLSELNLRVTVKWPNDLLFGGKKLGGILCETTTQASGFGSILIGVGINLTHNPEVDDQQTTSLSNIVGESFSESRRESITSRIYRSVYGQDCDPNAFFDEGVFGILKGDIWQSKKDLSFAEHLAITQDGHLQLNDVARGDVLDISSSHHDYSWRGLRPELPVFIADIGNTSTKIMGFRHGECVLAETLSVDHDYSIDDKLRSQIPTSGYPIFVGSVSESRSSQLQSLALRLGLRLVPIPKRPLRIDYSQYSFSSLGIDRLALAEAAVNQYLDNACIVVGCGTATTVDVIGSDRVYQGGWILPGLATGLRALHQFTDGLPEVPVPESGNHQSFLGQNTEESMGLGTLWANIFAIEALKGKLASKYPDENWQVIVTGGDGHILAKGLSQCEFIHNLVGLGLLLLVNGG